MVVDPILGIRGWYGLSMGGPMKDQMPFSLSIGFWGCRVGGEMLLLPPPVLDLSVREV